MVNYQVFKKLILYFIIPAQIVVFALLIPPFQKPDEDIHFMRTYSLVKGAIFCNDDRTISVNTQIANLYKDTNLVLYPRSSKHKLNTDIFISRLTDSKQINSSILVNINEICDFYYFAYLPQYTGLILGSLFTHNAYILFFIGRLVVASITYFWIYQLIKKSAEPYKLILLFTFALPMTLHQVSSYSYDAMHIMLGLTIFYLLGQFLTKKKLNNLDVIKFFLTILLFGLTKKIGYEWLVFLILLIPKKSISPIGKKYFIKIFVFIFFIFGLWSIGKINTLNNYILRSKSISINTTKDNSTINVETSKNNLAQPDKQITYIINNPLNFLITLIKTSLYKSGFYAQGVVGIFGWLDYGLWPVTYFLYGLFFIMIIYKNENKFLLVKSQKIMLYAILILAYTTILTLSYLYWTKPEEAIIDGVQGRYFITLIPFIALGVIDLNKNNLIVKIFFALIVLLLIFSQIQIIITRYFS